MRTLPLSLLLLAPAALAQTSTYAVFTNLTPTTQPPDRERAHMAFDEARGRVLLAGGYAGGNVRQDTWEWNGTAWQQVVPATQLNFGKQVRLTWSPLHMQILAVTGDDTAGPASQPMRVYGWTGTNWQLLDANGPPSRAEFYEIAWDRQRDVLVMFGSPSAPETWEWNGLVWQQRGSGGPLARSGHRMVYDEARQVVVLFGGTAATTGIAALTDTWEWNGSYWFEYFGIAPPGTSSRSAIAYDRLRQRVVLHGGYDGASGTGGVFEFDGNAWLTRQTSGGPSSMYYASMAYDAGADHMLLFGGVLQSTAFARTRTISFVTGYVAQSAPHQPGCIGPVGVPMLAALGSSRPVLGTTFQTRFTNLPNTPFALVLAALGYSDQAWGGVPLPFDLTPLGFTSCQLYVEPAVVEPLANVGGVANWNIAVPPAPSLDGLSFFLQGLVLTPGYNPGGGVTTSSLQCTAGVL